MTDETKSELLTKTGKFLVWLDGLRPCSRVIKAVNQNIQATADLRETVSHFDKTLEELSPALSRIAEAAEKLHASHSANK